MRYQVFVNGISVFASQNRAEAAGVLDRVICPNVSAGKVELRDGNTTIQSWDFIGINQDGQPMWRDAVAPMMWHREVLDVDTGHGRRNLMPRGDWTVAAVGMGVKDDPIIAKGMNRA